MDACLQKNPQDRPTSERLIMVSVAPLFDMNLECSVPAGSVNIICTDLEPRIRVSLLQIWHDPDPKICVSLLQIRPDPDLVQPFMRSFKNYVIKYGR